jgi:hypothetical protein
MMPTPPYIDLLYMRFKRATGVLLPALVILALSSCGDGDPTGNPGNGFNLRIDVAYIVQVAQARDGSVPLVAGRDGYVRVFAVGSEARAAAPSVRVRLYHGAAEVANYLLPAGSQTVVTAVDQGNASTSWNMRIPGNLIRPGLRMLAQVDAADAVEESSETDNFYPTTGEPQAITVHELPPLQLTVVPIHQTSNGRTGNVTPANLESFLSLTRKLHPIGELEVSLRAPYTTLAEPFDAEGNVWSRVVSELEAVRQVEAGDPAYYYGVVNPPYEGGGVVGIANGIPSRTSLGWDRFPDAPETMAHELGHNFGRRHAPCGGAGGSDPDYPYTLGLLGVYGMDVATGEIKPPNSFTDIMGYCESSWWISDYTFENVLNYRLANDQLPGASDRTSLLVWGRVVGGEIVLEPAFRVEGAGAATVGRGTYQVEGLNADGKTLFSYRFMPAELSDGPEGAKTFALRLPVGSALVESVTTLQVSGEGRSASASVSGAPVAQGQLSRPGARPPARRVDSRTVEVAWDESEYPMVMVRDAATGHVLSLSRGGLARVTATASELEIHYSDGVRSTERRASVGN